MTGRPRDPLLDRLRRRYPDASPRTIARYAKAERWVARYGLGRLPEEVRVEVHAAAMTVITRWIENGGGEPEPTLAERLAALDAATATAT